MNLPKIGAYFDDIIAHETTLVGYVHNHEVCLHRLSESKCQQAEVLIFVEKNEYFGHIVEYNKINKSVAKIRAV